MKDSKKMLGCFLKLGYNSAVSSENAIELANKFRKVIWGEDGTEGLNKHLSNFNPRKYGNDLQLILFEFYVYPSKEETLLLKPIGNFRSKEKSIGIPIIISDTNFLQHTIEERNRILIDNIFLKLDLLSKVVIMKKLDTNMDLLISDLHKILD